MDRFKPENESVPVLKQLSRMNGQLNRMSRSELINILSKLQMETRGDKVVLRKRLKAHYKRQKLVPRSVDNDSSSQSLSDSRCSFDFLCVIDFEATCEQERNPSYIHEIIEFPAVLVCVHRREIVREFHRYCRPTRNPQLTKFCTELTGITQQVVDSASEFPVVLGEFNEWLKRNRLGTEFSYAIVTDGPWDMGHFLAGQSKLNKLKFPKFGRKWINIRKTFSNFYDCKRINLEEMLKKLGKEFEGRQHSGLDDSRNIAGIVLNLLSDGAELRINETIQGSRTYPLKTNEIEDHSEDEDLDTIGGSKNRRLRRDMRNEKAVICIEEQMADLGIDPSHEKSMESLVQNKMALRSK